MPCTTWLGSLASSPPSPLWWTSRGTTRRIWWRCSTRWPWSLRAAARCDKSYGRPSVAWTRKRSSEEKNGSKSRFQMDFSSFLCDLCRFGLQKNGGCQHPWAWVNPVMWRSAQGPCFSPMLANSWETGAVASFTVVSWPVFYNLFLIFCTSHIKKLLMIRGPDSKGPSLVKFPSILIWEIPRPALKLWRRPMGLYRSSIHQTEKHTLCSIHIFITNTLFLHKCWCSRSPRRNMAVRSMFGLWAPMAQEKPSFGTGLTMSQVQLAVFKLYIKKELHKPIWRQKHRIQWFVVLRL